MGPKFHFDNIYKDNPLVYDSIILYQIGDLNCEGGYTIGEHEQYCYEISYIVSGKGIYFTNGNAFPVRQGDICLNRPGELHNGMADSIDPFRYFYIGFGFNANTAELNSIIHIQKMFDQVKMPVIHDVMGVENHFVKAFNEIINYKGFSDLMIKMHLQQILILAYRNYFDHWEKNYSAVNNTAEAKKIVYEVVNHIDKNMGKISELNMIAGSLGYSYTYLSHAFSRETGLTIKEYFDQKRFEKAVHLLKNSDLSVSRIAESLHYKSIHPFSTAFRKKFGISPTQYQQLNRGCKKQLE